MIMYYDMEGRPIGLEEWALLFESEERIIGRTELPGGCWVSTVWLGLDHSFGTGPPLVYESMVFASHEDMTDLDCVRYTTREQAEAGHSELVTRWTGWTPGDELPDDRQLSPITAILEAMSGMAEGWEHMTSPDSMVVMYPKKEGTAYRLTGDAATMEEHTEGNADE